MVNSPFFVLWVANTFTRSLSYTVICPEFFS